MSLHPRLSCSLLAASLLLAGCSSSPPLITVLANR